MSRKKIQCVAALLLVLALAGCGGKSNPEPTQPVTTRPTQPTETTTQPTEETTEPTQPTEPPPSLEPVTKPASILWRTYPQLLTLGSGDLLACRNYFEEGKGIINSLDIFNIYDDVVLAQGGNDSPRELIQQQFPDGCFVIADPETNTFFVYDHELQEQSRFTAPNTQGYFSYDRKNYYFVQDRVLYHMDVASGNYGRMGLEKDLRLEGLVSMHPDRDIICAKVSLSAYEDRWGMAVIDCTTGKLLLLRQELEYIWFDEDRFYGAGSNDQVFGYDIYMGRLGETTVEYVTTQQLGGDTVSYSVLADSGYMVLRTVDEKNLTTTVYDLEHGGRVCAMEKYDHVTSTLIPVYMEEEQLIFGLYPEGYDFAPVVIDPKVLEFESGLSFQSKDWGSLVDETLLAAYDAEKQGPALPQSLQTQRTQADALEKEYGVKILLGQQVSACWNGEAQTAEDPQQITQGLNALERALQLYPKGFFSQLRNGIKEGGVYLCLTAELEGELSPVGRTKQRGDRYEIALDITAQELDKTIHHELWHAIEMKLSADRFNHPQWNACNPRGFTYYGRYDKGYAALTDYTFAQSGPGCYFVDAYSKINGTEDRARLMEQVMAADAAQLLQSEALQKKLQIISTTLRENFNTTGWDTPYWERYF